MEHYKIITTDKQYQICYPPGGGGNHLRWLMFLDEQIVHNATPTISDKLEYIKNEIYPKNRGWFNWFWFEHKFNSTVGDTQLSANHEIFNWENTPQWATNSILYLSFPTPVLPYQHILQIALMARPPVADSLFENDIKLYNIINAWLDELVLIKNSNIQYQNKTIIDASGIFQPTLTKKLYYESINHFGFSDHFAEASLVHEWYHACRMRASTQFYDFFTSSRFIDFLEQINQTLQSHKL